MSKLIDTTLGQFRQVHDGDKKRFLFECPDCHEMLPMSEEVLAGKTPINHNSKQYVDTVCSFRGIRNFGAVLVSTMQALILTGEKPYHDEGQNE